MERSGVSQEIMNQNNNHSRVNFYDPSTIMNYGSDILKKIDELKDNYSTMDDDYEIDANMQEKIKKIDFFKRVEENEKIKKEEEKRKKALNSNLLMKGINSIFKIEEKMGSNAKTYGDLYREFVDNINSITDDIEARKNANITNVDRTKAFLSLFKKYVMELEELINIGYEDVNSFNNEVLPNLENNGTDKRTIDSLKANVQFFNNVLVELKECLVNYKNEITEFEIVNRGTMEIVFRQESFIKRYMSSVRGQGSLIIEAKRQKDDADQLTGIKSIINDTLENNAKQISDNIERINSLSCENFIEDKTFKSVNSMLGKCVDLIVSTDQNKQTIMEKRKKQLEEMSSNMKKYSDSLRLIASPMGNDIPKLESSNDNLDEPGFQKRLKK